MKDTSNVADNGLPAIHSDSRDAISVLANHHRHAPVTVTKGGNVTTFHYDLNGNMTAGLDGKAMTYDGENRPLSVTRNGTKTRLMSTAPTAPA